MARTHELKCWPDYFDDLASGAKTCELRYNDRSYQVGDVLKLREWDPRDGYSGRVCWRRVTHVLHGVGHVGAIAPLRGLSVNYVVLSLREMGDSVMDEEHEIIAVGGERDVAASAGGRHHRQIAETDR